MGLCAASGISRCRSGSELVMFAEWVDGELRMVAGTDRIICRHMGEIVNLSLSEFDLDDHPRMAVRLEGLSHVDTSFGCLIHSKRPFPHGGGGA